MIANHVRRPVPAFARAGAPLSEVRTYVDSLGLRERLRLRPVLAALRGSQGRGDRALRQHGHATGASRCGSFTYNHIGHFANASHAFAKALILGGVTHRFPQLRFAFLEGGVGWACNLVTDLVGHWERRRARRWRARRGRPTSISRLLARPVPRVRRPRLRRTRSTRSAGCVNLAEPFKTAEELTERAYRRSSFDDFAEVPVQSGRGAAAALRRALLLRLRGRRPDDRVGLRQARPPPAATRSSAPTSATSTCVDMIGGAGGGLGAGRARHDHRRRTSGSSSSPTRCGCTPRSTRTSSRARWWTTPWRSSLDPEVSLRRRPGPAIDGQDVLGTGREGDDQVHLGAEDRVAAGARSARPTTAAPAAVHGMFMKTFSGDGVAGIVTPSSFSAACRLSRQLS